MPGTRQSKRLQEAHLEPTHKKAKKNPKENLENKNAADLKEKTELEEPHVPELKFFHRKANQKHAEVPHEFITAHTKTFTDGLQFILDKDPKLLEAIESKGAFPICLKKETLAADKKKGDNFYFHKLVAGLITQHIGGKGAETVEQRVIDELTGAKKASEKNEGGEDNVEDSEFPPPEVFVNADEEMIPKTKPPQPTPRARVS
ncbi:unnamed protein product [Ambrosiozyma monospora]|uniref:Unnamed protein product n=1 Tax=Ambrosiozyma monospora TaxID=43982 RepID=A0ACB5TFU3_AMBMO|nr:unnamed protein product [Ambrosiozyma monospora]